MRESFTTESAKPDSHTKRESDGERTLRVGESEALAPTRVSIIDASLVGPEPATPEVAAATLPAPIGTVLRGRYELETILGSGGMGAVYRARDHLHEEMRDSNPFVAIKILNEQFKRHPRALMALQRETRKAQKLAHENIITVHNFDRDGPLVFMTMELLDGKSLRAIVADSITGLPHDEAVPMIRGMAKALAYAHENGIVHCDLKPGNVFFTGRCQIKVLDFGVSRALPRSAAASPLADEGEIGGMTPAYASPQMLAGEDPTPADDVFSLAVVCHELLTGRHPFDEQPADDTRLQQARALELPKLSWSQRRALARALAQEREARHQHAGEFLEDFDGPSQLKRVAYGSAAAAFVLPIATFLLISQNVEPRVEVAFEDLPQDVQTRFNDAVVEGETALRFGDAGINEAFQYFSQAYELHPNNPRAVLGLETVADRLLTLIPSEGSSTQRDALTLLYCQDYLSRYAPVATACSEIFTAEQCTAIAASCQPTARD